MAASVFVPFSPFGQIDTFERNLPHWNQDGTTYFVTFRLADSIPAVKLAEYKAERDVWLSRNTPPLTEEQLTEYVARFPDRFHAWLDAGAGECHLGMPAVSRIVEDTLKYFDGERYILDQYAVMPNHVHALVMPMNERSLSSILHSWKSFSANEANKRLSKIGAFWQDESYDHIVRSKEQLLFYRKYIALNPVKANLRDGEYRLGSGRCLNVDCRK